MLHKLYFLLARALLSTISLPRILHTLHIGMLLQRLWKNSRTETRMCTPTPVRSPFESLAYT